MVLVCEKSIWHQGDHQLESTAEGLELCFDAVAKVPGTRIRDGI